MTSNCDLHVLQKFSLHKLFLRNIRYVFILFNLRSTDWLDSNITVFWVVASYILVYKKLKVTLVQALRLCTGRTAHRGSRGIALPFHDHDTRRGWGVSVTPRPLFTSGIDTVPIVQEAVWAPGPVWTGAENFAPTGIRSPERPACSQLLCRLRYPTHIFVYTRYQTFGSTCCLTLQGPLLTWLGRRIPHDLWHLTCQATWRRITECVILMFTVVRN